MAVSGKLTKKLVKSLGPGRHGDGNGLYLVVDPSGARRWIVRVTVKNQRNQKGAPLRTDFGLGSATLVGLPEARDRALQYRRLARSGINPKQDNRGAIPTFEDLARQVHADRAPVWKNGKHVGQWISTLETYAFPFIGSTQVDRVGQPEVLRCLSPIWIEKHETASRLAQRIKTVLDVARSKGFRDGENPVTAIRDANILPRVKRKPKHHKAMAWPEVPAFYADLSTRKGMAAKALMFTCLTGGRTGEVLGMRLDEVDFETAVWTCPATRMKTGEDHRVPLTSEMMAIIEPLRSLCSEVVFEGQKRHRQLSDMAMLMLLRRMQEDRVTVHGFRSTFRDWVAEATDTPREVAEASLSHRVGSAVERAYARSDLLDKRRELLQRWSAFVTSGLPRSDNDAA